MTINPIKKLREYDAYAEYVRENPPPDKHPKASRVKTRIFLIAVVAVFTGLMTWYLITPQVSSDVVYNPSLDVYLHRLGEAPLCQCAEAVVTWEQAGPALTLPSDTNFSQNVCSTITEVAQQCIRASSGGMGRLLQQEPTTEQADSGRGLAQQLPPPPPQQMSNATCFDTPAGALFTSSYLLVLAVQCGTAYDAQLQALDSIGSHNFGPYLLSPTVLSQQVAAVSVDQVQRWASTVRNGNLLPLQVEATSYIRSAVDLSAGSLAQVPSGCSCRALGAVTSTKPGTWDECAFRIAFDNDNSTGRSNSIWTCNHAASLLKFPVGLFSANNTYEHLSLSGSVQPATLARWKDFTRPQNMAPGGSTIAEGTMQDVWNAPRNLFSYGTRAGRPSEADVRSLREGVAHLPYPAYFAACAPTQCQFTRVAPPTLLNALVAAVGVLAGIQTAVHVGIGWLCGAALDRLHRARSRRNITRRPDAGASASSAETDKDNGKDKDKDHEGSRRLPAHPQPLQVHVKEYAPRETDASAADAV